MGIMPVAADEVFGDVDGFRLDGALGSLCGDCFGFTDEEVREMAEAYGVPEECGRLADWYKGYRFGEHEAFNPWSVAMCLEGRSFEPLQVETARPMPEVLAAANARVLEDLKDGTIWTEMDPEHAPPVICAPSDGDPAAAIWSLLLVAGHLTTTGRRRTARSGRTEWELRFPTREVRAQALDEVLDSMSSASYGLRRDLGTAFVSGDCHHLDEVDLTRLMSEEGLAQLLAPRRPLEPAELRAWLRLVLGALFLKRGFRQLSSQREGRERADLAFVPPKEDLPGIVIHALRSPDLPEKALDELAATACSEALRSGGAERLAREGVHRVLAYGIGCNNGTSRVVMRELRP